MLDERSTQRARRVRVCAVLAMHVPHLGIHTSWRFASASIHPSILFTVKKESGCLCLPCRSIDICLFKMLRLPFALCSCLSFPLFLL